MLLLLLSLWGRASILLPPQSLSLILYCGVITTSTRSALIGEKLWAGARVSRILPKPGLLCRCLSGTSQMSLRLAPLLAAAAAGPTGVGCTYCGAR